MGKLMIGKVAFTPKGEFNINETYERLDVVTDGLTSYYSIKDENIGNPLSDPEYWASLTGVSEADVNATIREWLDEHPEATTTVQDGSITAEKLAANSVTASKLAANSVMASKIMDGNVITDKLANNCVTTAKLAANSVTLEKLADGVVELDGSQGMRKVILRKDLPFATQLQYENTIYVIQYDYDLNDPDGENPIAIPEGCVLKFDGGSIRNGILAISDAPIIEAQRVGIFSNIKFEGNGAKVLVAKVDWFIHGYSNDATITQSTHNNTSEIQEALDCGCESVEFPTDKFLYIDDTLRIDNKNIKLTTNKDNSEYSSHTLYKSGYGIISDTIMTMLDYIWYSTQSSDSLYIGSLNFIVRGISKFTDTTTPIINIINNNGLWSPTILANVDTNINGIAIKIGNGTSYIQGIFIKSKIINAFIGAQIVKSVDSYITDVTFDAKDVMAVIGCDFGGAAEIRVKENLYQPIPYYDSIDNTNSYFINGHGFIETSFVWDLSVYDSTSNKYTCKYAFSSKSILTDNVANTKISMNPGLFEIPTNELSREGLEGCQNFFNVARNYSVVYGVADFVFTVNNSNYLNNSNLFNDDVIFGNFPQRISNTGLNYIKGYNYPFVKESGSINVKYEFKTALGIHSINKLYFAYNKTTPLNIKIYKSIGNNINSFESEPYIDEEIVLYNKLYATYIEGIYNKIVVTFTDTTPGADNVHLLPTIFCKSIGGVLEPSRVTKLPNCSIMGKVVNYNNKICLWNGTKWVEDDGAAAGVARSGTTRPSGDKIYVGFQFFDTSVGINKPIYASAISDTSPYTVTWVDATGTAV